MAVNAKPVLHLQAVIAYATAISKNLRRLLSDDRQHVNRTNRDSLCLLHWSLVFEHHEAILLLLRESFHASAFALLRPFVEAFARLYLSMHGTENQVAALWAGTLNNIDFASVWGEIDERFGSRPRFGPKYKAMTSMMHGFTHGGKEQLVRQATGQDIVSSYTEDEVRNLVKEIMPVAFFAATFTTEFLGYPDGAETAVIMFSEYFERLASGQL
jgi:hypothetical protein